MKKYEKHFGDRKDARRVRNITGLAQICIDLKPHRSVSDVFINQKIDVTNLVKYVEKRKKAGDEITYFHTFLAAIGKLLYNRPKLNYFIADRHIFEHDEIIISFVAKVAFDDRSEELMFLIPIEEDDTLDSISTKVSKKIRDARERKSVKKGANNAIDFLGKLPNILRKPILGMFKLMDIKGWVPDSLCKDNLYYSSIIVSNLGSIHCGAIFHNINDFGTCSSLLTIGEIKDEEVIIDGKKQIRKMCEFGVNLDERIADGYYFVKSLQVLQQILDDPKLLEEKASEKVEIKEIR